MRRLADLISDRQGFEDVSNADSGAWRPGSRDGLFKLALVVELQSCASGFSSLSGDHAQAGQCTEGA